MGLTVQEAAACQVFSVLNVKNVGLYIPRMTNVDTETSHFSAMRSLPFTLTDRFADCCGALTDEFYLIAQSMIHL